jgi:hypothetical protein
MSDVLLLSYLIALMQAILVCCFTTKVGSFQKPTTRNSHVGILNIDAIVRLLALAAAIIAALRRPVPAIEQTRTNPGAQLWLMCC